MKKFIIFSIIVIFCVFLTHTITAVEDENLVTNVSGTNIPIYRIYSEITGEHLFTPSEKEVEELTNNKGWIDEGIAWYAPRQDDGDAVYRLFNDELGNHLYTTDNNEVKTLKESGWSVDFGEEPIFYSSGTDPIYRIYNSDLKVHQLTIDENEYKSLGNAGWKKEGIAFYSVPSEYTQVYELDSNEISNLESDEAIQVDINLGGSGSGFQGRIVMSTPTSSVSFGPQYDTTKSTQYNNEVAFIIENTEDASGTQSEETRIGAGSLGEWYRLLLTNNNGTIKAYINGKLVSEFKNLNLSTEDVTLALEGAARQDGDTVQAVFDNIKLKDNSIFNSNNVWNAQPISTNLGISVDTSNFNTENHIEIRGVIGGLNGKDWDSAYDKASGIVEFSN